MQHRCSRDSAQRIGDLGHGSSEMALVVLVLKLKLWILMKELNRIKDQGCAHTKLNCLIPRL